MAATEVLEHLIKHLEISICPICEGCFIMIGKKIKNILQ